jgi:energy-coupling factor transport system substrate-specific component
MSWQLGAFGLLAVALAAGFAWYERTRPDARILALVATLAALATLGRVAFAALPNIKPTTDIVLIAGYALGGAPGFVVGAVTGLVSNFFFGQGPWTVWQMAAWAATGLVGATLARLTAGRVARWPLAIICALVGFAFAAFQDVGDWVTYSDHSLAQLGIYVGKGTAFDAVHAAGCFVFALAFGLALLRALRRFRSRLDVTWLPAEGLPLLVAAVAVAALGGLGAATSARAAATPTSYLRGAQNRDGGFGAAPGSPSSSLYAGWAALGLAAEGVSPAGAGPGGASALTYIAGTLSSGLDVGSLERTILVVHAGGANPSAFAGRNLVAMLDGDIRRDGSVNEQTNLTAFAVLALRAAGAPVRGSTVRWLAGQQNSDGGFGFGTAGGASDVDDTGAVLEALAPGGPARLIRGAVSFIRAAQNGDGGLPSQPGGPSNAQSTAWAIQGLIAAGVDPSGVRRGHSAMDYLASLIAPDGHVRYAAGLDQTPVWVTGEALMALARRTLPLGPVPAPAVSHSSPGPATHHPSSGAARARSHARTGPAPRPRRARAKHHPRRGGAAAVAPVGQVLAADFAGLYYALQRALAPVEASLPTSQ